MQTKPFIKIGHLLYGTGIIAVGTHQLIIKSFRPEIFPPFPGWVNQNILLPVIAGILLIVAGLVISDLFEIKFFSKRNTCLYLGFAFLIVFIICQVSYNFIFNAKNLLKLDSWFAAAEELAFCGGAFVMAASFPDKEPINGRFKSIITILEKLIPLGRSFFAILMILFGCSHFVFADFVSSLIPKWFGPTLFWTYLTGAALICAGIAIILKIWIKHVAILLAVMLFLFFVFFHIPDAYANPYQSGGAEIVRAIIALMFCGIALVIAYTGNKLILQEKSYTSK